MLAFALIEPWSFGMKCGEDAMVLGELTVEERATEGVSGGHCELGRDLELLGDWNNW